MSISLECIIMKDTKAIELSELEVYSDTVDVDHHNQHHCGYVQRTHCALILSEVTNLNRWMGDE
ncbi:hypothetical protein RO3G_09977 [Rhizopus delemar RA 99-880]|uniref:Uncharacterized protein n=1 Tax=Rhizopus delemar (strain RA 99-880 / ATCC MYA-4621 / FGSC 9543 / NRRL 43880) TaxID=246409 RepID=I1C9Y7_RHIO9|nr:hypothetical protein RO3G_09977 [Rhizopus delemar RA 99-880]|eukprot:EIE85267.1 hypothetical protein RO3G_09977 [Rhizopus delemar RA 99-880]